MVKLTKAITHSVGADWSLLDFPKLCSNSAVRGHSIREPSHPNGNQPSMVMQGHRIKIGGLGRMANSAFGGKLNLCGTWSYLFTMCMVYLVVDNKCNVYVR